MCNGCTYRWHILSLIEHTLTVQVKCRGLLMKVRQQLQRIESLAQQISAAQAASGPAPETSLPLNALKPGVNRSARTGMFTIYLLHFC